MFSKLRFLPIEHLVVVFLTQSRKSLELVLMELKFRMEERKTPGKRTLQAVSHDTKPLIWTSTVVGVQRCPSSECGQRSGPCSDGAGFNVGFK